MKSLGVWILIAAAAALAWVAFRAPDQNYVPFAAEQVEPEAIPLAITSAVPAGEVIRTFDVTGMCCNGCTAKLFDALEAHPAVSAAAVSFQHGTAQACVSADVDPSELSAALTFDKYSASLQTE